MKGVKNVFYLVVFAYVCLLSFYFGMQRRFLYAPPPPPYVELAALEAGDRALPQGVFQEVSYVAEDGVALKGWYAPSSSGADGATIVYFHGNADTLGSAVTVALPYVEAGYGFFLAEYRGYSGLSGAPTQDGLFADARAAMLKVFDRGVALDDMIVMGHSLGSGVASQMAVEFQAPRLVLIAPFFSALDVARERYPFLPVALLLLDRYENDSALRRYDGAVDIVHGDRDVVIPVAHAKRLFALAHGSKRLHIIEGGGHSDILALAAPMVMESLAQKP